MPSREAKVIEPKAPLKLGAELARGVWGVLPGEAVLWAGEQTSALTTGAGQTPNTGQSKGRHGDHKRNTKISVSTNNVFRNLGSELHL